MAFEAPEDKLITVTGYTGGSMYTDVRDVFNEINLCIEEWSAYKISAGEGGYTSKKFKVTLKIEEL